MRLPCWEYAKHKRLLEKVKSKEDLSQTWNIAQKKRFYKRFLNLNLCLEAYAITRSRSSSNNALNISGLRRFIRRG